MASLGGSDREWVLQVVRGFAKRAENYTGREFYTEARTETFSTDGTKRYLQLRAFGTSTNTVTTVHEDTDKAFNAADLVKAADYDFDWRTGLLSLDSGRWTRGQNVIQVVWTGGLGTSADAVPDDLRQAAILQSVYWWQRRNELGLQSKNMKDGTVNVNVQSTLLPEVREILDSYRIL
jgi:hypothetical protein